MKRALNGILSRRHGIDGWALRIKGADKPLMWTFCTTRQEARELRAEEFSELDFWRRTEIVKVKLNLEVVRWS